MSIVRFSCLFCNTKISEKSEMAKNNFYTIMNICIFVGARPNFIKVAPILRAMDAAGVDHSLVYAGREDDPTLALLPPIPAVNRRSDNPSITSRFISLGMLISNERVPATR